MTAIYVPPPEPRLTTAGVSFSGMFEITDAANAAIMQKSVYLDSPARIKAAWVSGVDGMDVEATGQTVIHVSDQPHDQQDENAQVAQLALPAGQARSVVPCEMVISTSGWIHIFIVQAAGGHYGAQLGLQIQWEDA